MQWVADVLVGAISIVRDFVAATWFSLILLAIYFVWRPARSRPGELRARRHTVIVYITVAVVALAAAMAQTIVAGEPHPPWYTDDFGNLLSADTFAHGRLSNPTHPLHRYFETLYILQTPRYASVYPPAQALLLAAAQRLLGLRVAGLWIASAAASCAIVWAVAAVAPIGIALLAGLLSAIHPAMMECAGGYPPGAIAGAGGALAIGGALRTQGDHRMRAAMAMGIGF